MNCEIIKDLLPLYIDSCCSNQSKEAVKTHLDKCSNCKKMLDSMQTNIPETIEPVSVSKPPKKVKIWLASMLQSVMFFLSFLAITIGVSLEAATPFGDENGFWAFAIVVPATGFLFSLVNWYFVRLYKSRFFFSIGTALTTIICTATAFLWAFDHYNYFHGGINIFTSILLCIVSYVISDIYARFIGKEQ